MNENIIIIANKIRIKDDKPFNIRIFGSQNCNNCKTAYTVLQMLKLSYQFVDAFDENTQKICDDNNVNKLPHIQILKAETVLWEKHGEDAIGELVQIIKQASLNTGN